MGQSMPRHIRAEITAELATLFNRVDVLIARLDAADPDPDLEEDDPSGDPLEIAGEMPDDEGRGILPMRPVYGVDQSAGPINYKDATETWTAQRMGLVRSATGGWRRAA